jgi:hypothetical protein
MSRAPAAGAAADDSSGRRVWISNIPSDFRARTLREGRPMLPHPLRVVPHWGSPAQQYAPCPVLGESFSPTPSRKIGSSNQTAASTATRTPTALSAIS